jgi:type I restriction enzyme M protein
MAKNGKTIKVGNKNLPLLDASVETLENSVCADFLKKLQNEYGFKDEQIAVNQKFDDFEAGLGWAKADIVVWKSVEDKQKHAPPFIVVQGKFQDGLRLQDYFEGVKFAQQNKATLFVTIERDGKNPSFYKIAGGKFISIETPKDNELFDSKKIDAVLSHDENFKRDEFKKLLFACHNIIRNNDKFSPEMAFDEISKVMFSKIWYEREEGKLLTKKDLETEQGRFYDEPFYQVFFKRTKKAFEKDEIFEETDKFRIREESFFQIIEKLEKNNLAEIFDDVKGLAFEEFLGTTFRGDLGQFFTPRTVVDFMADIIDPQENELIADPCCGSGGFLIKSFDLVKDAIADEIKAVKLRFRRQIIDENFLKLSATERKSHLQKLDKVFADLNRELSPKFSGKEKEPKLEFDETDKQSRLYKLSNNCIFGTDAEPRSARTAKMNMIMRGDGHSGVHYHDGLLHVNGMLSERFDVILTNPPFGARISRDLLVSERDIERNDQKIKEYVDRYGQKYSDDQKTLEAQINQPVLELFDTGKEFLEEDPVENSPKQKKKPNPIKSTLTEVVFMERCLDLLKKGGRMGVVLPEGFLNTMDLQLVREYFEGRAKLVFIASIPQDVFIAAGATVKPSLVFLKRFTEAEEIEYKQIEQEVTDLIKAKYQPQIVEIEAEYQLLKHSVDSFDKSLRQSKADLKKKDSDQAKLQNGITFLQEQLAKAKDELRKGKKERDKKLAEIENRKKREIVQGIKDKFDYEFPIVQAKDAGVTSTGSASGKSDFPIIEQEFKEYRQMRLADNDPLWLSEKIEYEYSYDNFMLQRRLKPIEIEEIKNKNPKVEVSFTAKIDFSA